MGRVEQAMFSLRDRLAQLREVAEGIKKERETSPDPSISACEREKIDSRRGAMPRRNPETSYYQIVKTNRKTGNNEILDRQLVKGQEMATAIVDMLERMKQNPDIHYYWQPTSRRPTAKGKRRGGLPRGRLTGRPRRR